MGVAVRANIDWFGIKQQMYFGFNSTMGWERSRRLKHVMKLVRQLSNRQGKGVGKGNFYWLCIGDLKIELCGRYSL